MSVARRCALVHQVLQLSVPLTADCERYFRPDRRTLVVACTRPGRMGASKKVRTREQSALDDARSTQCAKRAIELFVTVLRLPHVQLAAGDVHRARRREPVPIAGGLAFRDLQ